jgi:serine/threonine protein kinase
LADFGWSNYLRPNANDVRDTFCGTLDYLAPEMLTKKHEHDFSVDIWAIGVLAYELSSGLSPFAPKDR